MEYTDRTIDFFLHSLHYLKSKSGGQRWNAICEDTVELFFDRFPNELGTNPFTPNSLWSFLFEPPTDPEHHLSRVFADLCTKEVFVDFFFRILQILLDPPAHLWRW